MLLGGTAGVDGGWPEGLELEMEFRQLLERLLSESQERRFGQASEVLKALESIVLPEYTKESRAKVRISRAQAREQEAEGRLWPVVIALGLSALVSSALGWFMLQRTSPAETAPVRVVQQPSVSLPPAGLDQRQQLFSRLRALQVDRSWFFNVIYSSQISLFPERSSSLNSESLEDALVLRVWTELVEEWLARIEQLPPVIRARLGRLRAGDWEQPRQKLVQQGVHPKVVEYLVSARSQELLPVSKQGQKPVEPFRQLWIAAAMQSLVDVEIVRLTACPLKPAKTSLRIPAGGARLVLVEVPVGDDFALGINGTPLMQMMLFGANGRVVEERGPLQLSRMSAELGSLMQVLITNEGVASGVITLSCPLSKNLLN